MVADTVGSSDPARGFRVGGVAKSGRRPPLPPSTRPPLSGSARPTQRRVYVFPIAGCRASYNTAHHDYAATDLFAFRGCRFVAPTDGVIDEIGDTDTWDPDLNAGATRGGRFVSMLGVDGVRYYGSHLESIEGRLRPGFGVRAGTTLGRIGDSGSARGTGPHLHFGISWPSPAGRWWVRRGTVSPGPFLDAWRTGSPSSPVADMRAALRRQGPMPRCESYC